MISYWQAKVREYADCMQLRGRGEAQAVIESRTVCGKKRKANSANSLRAVRALVEAMANHPGRKMIVLTSSGFLTGNLEQELEEITHNALRGGVVINALDPAAWRDTVREAIFPSHRRAAARAPRPRRRRLNFACKAAARWRSTMG